MGWKKGQSGNPSGRPRSGNSLAEAIRRTVNPDDVVSKLWDLANNSASEQTRLRALELLMERGFKKPAAVIEVGPSDPYEDLSDEELAALEAEVVAEIESDPVAGLLCDGNQEESASEGVIAGHVAQESMSDAGKAARAPSPEADPPESRVTQVRVGVLRRKPGTNTST